MFGLRLPDKSRTIKILHDDQPQLVWNRGEAAANGKEEFFRVTKTKTKTKLVETK